MRRNLHPLARRKTRASLCLGTAAIVVLLAALTAQAAQALSTRPARTFVTNGPVDAVLPTAGATYIGGNFTRVGPRTGPGAGIDSSTGKSTGLADIAGGALTVAAVAADGSGGFYIGGDFRYVGGVARKNLAHILANGSVDPGFNPNPNNAVDALAVSGSTVYAGGNFTSIGGQARNHIAALDATSGAATGWDPNADGPVYAIRVSGSTVYAGGQFSSIGGEFQALIAALDATTGEVTSWDPSSDHIVRALAVSGSTVYAGSHSSTQAFDASTGDALWSKATNAPVRALAVSGSTVYAGGDFTSIGGQDRNQIAALDATTGATTAWNPNAIGGTRAVHALAVSGSTVYAGGAFTSIGGQARRGIAALDATSGGAIGWNPHAEGGVLALAVSGTTVYAGGQFSSIGGSTRNKIAALDPTTGELTAWNPNANGRVRTLAISGSTVYAGGNFTSIGGQTRNRIAALNATSGAATGWNPNASNPANPGFTDVFALRVSGPTVYAGGDFTSIGGQTRNHIAALNATTGAATGWNPNANGPVYALRIFGSTVYAGGAFTSIGAKARNRIAALNATGGAARPWNPNANAPVWALALPSSGSTVYAGGDFASIGGKARNRIAALNTTGGAATGWNPNAIGGTRAVHALAVSGSTVYAGGVFNSIGGQVRHNIAGLNATSGAATGWNPNPNGRIYALAIGPDGSLWAGGTFTDFPTAAQRGIARFTP